MTEPLLSWGRPYYTPGGGDAFLFYVVFGAVDNSTPLNAQKYRCAGVPAGLDLQAYDRTQHPELFADLLEGYLWEQLQEDHPELAAAVRASSRCLILQGTVADPPNLDYLRDTVGLLTYCLDQGACVVFDPHMFRWWPAEVWKEEVFDPGEAVPARHVSILVSEEEGGEEGHLWLHTRGLRKFGRPDISVHHVPPDHQEAIVELCDRFIQFQALGAVIPEGQEVRLSGLPPGGTVHHGGDVEDPEFNNVHIKITWPDGL